MVFKHKKLLSFILCIIIIFCGSNMVYAVSDETLLYDFEYPVEYPNESFFTYPELRETAGPNVETLETMVDIDEFRDHLMKNFASCPTYVNITSFKIADTTANQTAVRSFIWYETPELFHIKGLGFSTSGGYLTAVYASYHYTATEYATMFTEFTEGADKLLNGIKDNDNLTDVEKALLLHDRIAVSCEYTMGTKPRSSYNAYGVFVEKSAVCMGYALAYDYLLKEVGIDSYYCSSSSLNHAWNIVYINGVKYHVDVTWDDPTYDRSGRVRHVNFLRSTAGITETGHDATDYDSSPTDTTYDSYYWQNSNAAFQLVGDDIYYIDSSAATLNKISNGVTTTCRSVSNRWMASSNSYWTGNYTTLSYDGENLLYSQPKGVYSYNINSGTAELIYTPDFSAGDYYNIYGFKYEDCQLICEVYSTPNFELTTAAENTQTKEHHVSSDWITDASGNRYKKCINCNCILELDTSGVQIITAVGNTVINNDNYVVFTDVFCCDDINTLVAINSAFSFDITKSNSTLCGTGTTVKISYQNFAVCDYTLIVKGDLNGDSVCDVLDVSQAEKFSTEKTEPEQNQIYAANGTVSDGIDTQSYQNVVNIALAA